MSQCKQVLQRSTSLWLMKFLLPWLKNRANHYLELRSLVWRPVQLLDLQWVAQEVQDGVCCPRGRLTHMLAKVAFNSFGQGSSKPRITSIIAYSSRFRSYASNHFKCNSHTCKTGTDYFWAHCGVPFKITLWLFRWPKNIFSSLKYPLPTRALWLHAQFQLLIRQYPMWVLVLVLKRCSMICSLFQLTFADLNLSAIEGENRRVSRRALGKVSSNSIFMVVFLLRFSHAYDELSEMTVCVKLTCCIAQRLEVSCFLYHCF